MELYSIVKDEKMLIDFIDWLPDLNEGELYYCCLFARKKYSSKILKDKAQLKRFTSEKRYLLDKIYQLEIPVGRYKQDGGEPIPQEALAMYITPNPRNLRLAAKKSSDKFTDYLYDSKDKSFGWFNPHQIVLSEIQVSCKKPIFKDFDFDHVEYNESDFNFINRDCLHVVKTNGGFHVLVEVNKVDPKYTKSWYMKMSQMKGVDVRGDNLLPIPGCCQGGFVPYFIK